MYSFYFTLLDAFMRYSLEFLLAKISQFLEYKGYVLELSLPCNNTCCFKSCSLNIDAGSSKLSWMSLNKKSIFFDLNKIKEYIYFFIYNYLSMLIMFSNS